MPIPMPATLAALKAGAHIITDIRMVQVGIQKKGHTSKILCALDFGGEIAREKGITRSSAGFIALKDQLAGSIVVIGNAPSALLTVCGMIREGIRPAVVIGAPVGFVNAAESKAVLRSLDIPSISTEGTRAARRSLSQPSMNASRFLSGNLRHEGPGHRFLISERLAGEGHRIRGISTLSHRVLRS